MKEVAGKEKVPLFSRWRYWYILLIVVLGLLIVLFYYFTRHFE